MKNLPLKKPTPLQWGILFGTACLLILTDQLTKAWVVANFALYESKTPLPFLKDVFAFTYTRNTGAAFGMFQNASHFFLVVAVIATGIIIYYYRQIEGDAWALRVALGLQMGGAIGNALDRLTRGYVVDFMHVFYDPLGFDFPIFNVADSAVVVGVGLLIWVMWGYEEPPEKSDGLPKATTDDELAPE